jgi:hypothetical protein
MVMCSPANDQLYTLDHYRGWVFRHGADGMLRRVCWLPYERRAEGVLACWNERVCIGSASGVVTILNFADLKHDDTSAPMGQRVSY